MGLRWSRQSVGGRRSGPSRAVRMQDDAEVEERDQGIRAGPTGPRCGAARHGPRAGEIPSGGAARSQSGAETTIATVVEERELGIRAGPTGPRCFQVAFKLGAPARELQEVAAGLAGPSARRTTR
jgi:hypothetical protein